MDNKQILELALEALDVQKKALEAEISSLRSEMGGASRMTAAPVAMRRRRKIAAGKKTQPRKMKALRAAKKTQAKKAKAPKKAAPPRSVYGPQSVAARKAQSERMKAYWAKKKTVAAKAPAAKKAEKNG